MSWEIRLPFRDESDPILSIDRGELETLGPGDAEIAGHIVGELAFTDGIETVADALSHLEQLGHAGRRQMLDRARVANGWPTTAAVDEAERRKAAPIVPVRRVGKQVDSQGRLLQTCGEPGCPAYPTDEHGALIGSDFIRWYCPDHAAGHEAEMVPRQPPRLLLQAAGGFEFEGELLAETERDEAQHALVAEDFERRRQEAAAGWETTRKARERYEAATADDDFLNPPIAGIDRSRIAR